MKTNGRKNVRLRTLQIKRIIDSLPITHYTHYKYNLNLGTFSKDNDDFDLSKINSFIASKRVAHLFHHEAFVENFMIAILANG